MRLLLLRHGQTPSNVLGQLDTAVPGASLTTLGFTQAAAVPAALGEEVIGAIYVSTLLRTQLTAAPLAELRALEPYVDDGLREISAGSMEMNSDQESLGIYTSTAFAWATGDLDLRMPGGEDGHDFFARYDAAVEGIVRSGHAGIVAVSHGAAIRTWVAARCVNTDGQFAGSHQLDNTGMAILESTDDHAWQLLDWVSTPIGGITLSDHAAADPIGEAVAL